MNNHKTFPKKRFGQNFLHDKNCIQKIVTAVAIKPHDHLVEIGPGLGALTKELLPLVKYLDVIEIDRDLIPQLESAVKDLGELRVHQADVLQFDFATIAQLNKMRIVGNLPYNISTPLLFHLLKYADIIQDCNFMLQREVAERIVAQPGSKIYGRLSVMVQYYYEPKILFPVKAGSFTPKPKVDSSFIKLIPRVAGLRAHDPMRFADIVRLAFNQRRKTIKNSVAKMVSSAMLQSLGIDPKIRAEELAMEDFIRISNGKSNE